jgi:hypothetical protein
MSRCEPVSQVEYSSGLIQQCFAVRNRIASTSAQKGILVQGIAAPPMAVIGD